MGSRRGGNRDTRAGQGNPRPGRDRPRPSVAEAARLMRAAGRDRRYAGQGDAEVVLAAGGWAAMESWACAQKIAATQELIRRRPGDPRLLAAVAGRDGTGPADPDALPPAWDKTVGEELALELSCSVYSGAALADLSYALGNRLPLTAAALEAGVLDTGKVRLIAAETAVLDDAQARAAEAEIAGRWEGVTWGELRDLVTVAVINADPEGARKRREEASRDARYRFCLDRGALTATLAGSGLPPAEAIRADQRVRARARGYRRHGIEGTFDQLCALAYLDLLTGRDARDRIGQGQDPGPGQDEDEEAAWASRLAAGPAPGEDAAWDPAWGDGPLPDDPDAATLAEAPRPQDPCPDEPRPDEPVGPGTRDGGTAPETGARNHDSRDDDGGRDGDDPDGDDQDEDGESGDDDRQDEDGQDGTGGDGGGDGEDSGPGGWRAGAGRVRVRRGRGSRPGWRAGGERGSDCPAG